MPSTSAILWGMLFGSIGMGYVVYGRRQEKGVALLSGIGLCVLPCFVGSALWLVVIGVILSALPFFVRY